MNAAFHEKDTLGGFTMSTAVPAFGQHATMRVIWITAAAALGGFLFGYDTAVINGAVDAIRGELTNPRGQ